MDQFGINVQKFKTADSAEEAGRAAIELSKSDSLKRSRFLQQCSATFIRREKPYKGYAISLNPCLTCLCVNVSDSMFQTGEG